ncbi:MAG: hypothetical protein KGQ36_06850 [Rickettsiales bacterium]|nr:hypothetical protein [Rickettsiales bacterium]
MNNEDDHKKSQDNNTKKSWTDIISDNKKDEDSDQDFRKKDEEDIEKKEEKIDGVKSSEEVQEVIDKFKNIIFPKSTQQRSLDVEIGGLEEKEDKGISEEDVWDDRPEEIKKMSVNAFKSSAVKSAIADKKKKRLSVKHIIKESALIGLASKNKSFSEKVDTSKGGGKNNLVR